MRVDLRTKKLSEDVRAWVVFPGRRRRLYAEFVEQSKVALELPSLGYGDIDFRSSASDADLAQRIRRSFALSAHYDDLRREREIISPPEPELGAYARTLDDGRVNTMAGCVRSLFQKMQVGDIVLVPSRGTYNEVMIGEVASEFSRTDNINVALFRDAPLNARRVKWINKVEERRFLPRGLALHLERPPAVHVIPQGILTLQAFGFAYESYQSDETAETRISAPNYNGRTIQNTLAYVKLISYLSAVYYAQRSGVSPEQLGQMPIDAVIRNYLPDDALNDYQVQFASPGISRIRPREAMLAMYLTAMTILVVNHAQDWLAGSPVNAENSLGELQENEKSSLEESAEYLRATMQNNNSPELREIIDRNSELGTDTTAIVDPDE